MIKHVCKRCVQNNRLQGRVGAKAWSYMDDDRWEGNKINCFAGKETFSFDDIEKAEPPEGCPYLLEHVVLSQKELFEDLEHENI